MGSGQSSTSKRIQSEICNDIRMHVFNGNSFLAKMRKTIKGIDTEPFKDTSIERLQEILPMGEHKESSMIFMVYLLLLRSKSQMADLMLTLIHSDLEILHTLSNMIERDEWPKTFSGHNQLPSVARKESDFLYAYISSITKNPKMRLVSSKVSSPFVSIFQIIKTIVEKKLY